jgi:hypothetical protein
MKNVKNYREKYLKLTELYQKDSEIEKIKEINIKMKTHINSTLTQTIKRTLTSQLHLPEVTIP